jgi:hypothetical protein
MTTDARDRSRRPPLRARTVALMLAAFAAGAAVTGAVAASSSGPGDTPIVELRPTGVGLPDTGATETFGVLEMPAAIRDYHDSGEYAARSRSRAASARTSSGTGSRSWPTSGTRTAISEGGHAKQAFKLPNPMYYIP